MTVLDPPTGVLPPTEPPTTPLPAVEPDVFDGGLSRYLLWGSMLLGTILLCAAYLVALGSPERQNTRYLLLWAGLACILAPAAARLFDPLVGRVERELILTGIALFTVVPKLLRNPSGPLFFDELAHHAQSERLYASGDLLERNPLIAVADVYPGLHVVTASLRHLTGLSTWQIAVAIIVATHLLAIFGVFRLARVLTGNDRVSGLAAVVYALNPAFLFFNSQYAYQSLAITFLIWCLVYAIEASNPTADQRKRYGSAAVALLFSVATIVTHHGSTLMLAAFLGVIAVVLLWRARADDQPYDGALLVLGLSIATVVLGAIWLVVGSRGDPGRVIDYLASYPVDGVQEMFRILGGGTDDRREVFRSSNIPTWAQLLAYLAPPLALAAGIKGFLITRRMRQPHPAFGAFTIVAALYALALPLVLTRTGAQGAHRSFPFSWVALSVLAGIGLAAWHREAYTRSADRGRTVEGVLVSLIVLVGLGNLATNANDNYVFPGPWVAGSDTRAYDAELSAITEWFTERDIDGGIIADIYTGAPIAALADPNDGCRLAAACPDTIPIWHVYYDDELGPATARKLADDGYRWLVVERRMGEELPRSGFWFTPDEPDAFSREEPLDDAQLERVAGRPWAHRVLATRHFDVYRLDFDQLGEPVDVSKPPVPATDAAASGESEPAAGGAPAGPDGTAPPAPSPEPTTGTADTATAMAEDGGAR